MSPRSLLVLSLLLAAPLTAQGGSPWRALTEADVRAAHALLRDNHPGAVEAIGDSAFRTALAAGLERALARAATVRDWPGYVATLRGLAYAMGDKHILFRTTQVPRTLAWPGVIVALRGGDWVVVDRDDALAGAPALGSALRSCDGVAVETLAEARLAESHAVWGVEAQRIAASPWLLVDEGNPFAPPPGQCRFRDHGVENDWTLPWRTEPTAAVLERIAAGVSRGAAGFGIRAFAAGTWVAIESFNARAAQVADSAMARAAGLRTSPMIVVDLRGNGGGNSEYGRRLAMAIYGEAFVGAVLGAIGGDAPGCRAVFRASADNLANWRRFVDGLRERGEPETAAAFAPPIAEMEAALAAGRAMSGPVCPPEARPSSDDPSRLEAIRAAAQQRSAYHRPVVLVTDHACFSSCLQVTAYFRALGAIHAGETTDAATHYMEYRDVRLPSGLGTFSTLQKVALAVPRAIGPYRPDRPYPGAIADTDALEVWVAGTIGTSP